LLPKCFCLPQPKLNVNIEIMQKNFSLLHYSSISNGQEVAPDAATDEEVSAIADALLEFRKIAKLKNLSTLAGLLEIAFYEAFSAANRTEGVERQTEHEMSGLESIGEAAMASAATGLSGQLPRELVKAQFDKRFGAESWQLYSISELDPASEDLYLSESESGKALRVSRIVALADIMFGNDSMSDKWLNAPLKRFDNRSPMQMLNSEAGAAAVEELLLQVEHGIYA
jgi:hypothetical protein